MQSRALLASVEHSDPRYKELPPQYTSMKPLDNAAKTRGATGSLGYVTTVYKVVNSKDGLPYCVRRADYVRSSNQVTGHVLKRWGNIVHPAIVPLRDCFVYQSGVAVMIADRWLPCVMCLILGMSPQPCSLCTTTIQRR